MVSEEWESKSPTLLAELSKMKSLDDLNRISSKNNSTKNNSSKNNSSKNNSTKNGSIRNNNFVVKNDDIQEDNILNKINHYKEINNNNNNKNNDNDNNDNNILKSLLSYYESKQNTQKCIELRKKILQESINLVQGSRRFGALRTFWPLGGRKASHQFMIPNMDLIYPTLIMPEKRFLLFPSKSRKRYKISEILSWNTDNDNDDTMKKNDHNNNNNDNNYYCHNDDHYTHENKKEDINTNNCDDDNDDHLMYLSEKKNIRKRNYEFWLTLESNRIDECQRMFFEEDKLGKGMRSYWNDVEYNINLLQPPQPRKQYFALVNNPLPGTYEFIKQSTPLYYHGTGK